MGNDISCISSLSTSPTATVCIARNRSRPLITIVSPLDGRACRFKEPLNVGELMLEIPGHFVAEFGQEQLDRCMVACRRISALPADCNLCAQHVYYILPMDRLNTRLANRELRKIVMATRLVDPSAYNIHTSKIAPLPSLRYEEAVMSLNKRRNALHRPNLRVKAGIDRSCKRSEEGKLLHTYQVDDKVGNAEEEDKIMTHTHERALMKRKPNWVPKLDTIVELTAG